MTSVFLIIAFAFAFASRFWMPEPGVSAVGTWFLSVHAIPFFALGAAFRFSDENRWLCGFIFVVLLGLEIVSFPYSTGGVGRLW